jgi:hypothetical protein
MLLKITVLKSRPLWVQGPSLAVDCGVGIPAKWVLIPKLRPFKANKYLK